MKAYLIDPFEKQITEVEHNGDYKQIQEFIEADLFTVVRINDFGDVLYVDDEGLLKEEGQAFFLFDGYPQPLAGKALVLGTTTEGESDEPVTRPPHLDQMVTWFDGEVENSLKMLLIF